MWPHALIHETRCFGACHPRAYFFGADPRYAHVCIAGNLGVRGTTQQTLTQRALTHTQWSLLTTHGILTQWSLLEQDHADIGVLCGTQ